MAERSQFWTTGTTGDGTTTISEAQTIEWFRDILIPFASAGPNTAQGVLVGVLGELAVTGASSPVSVAAGAAVVEGYYYKADAAVSVAVATPVAGTRIDRIVLRASHSTTRTVRVTRIAGVEASGTPPALVQTAGTTWDIPLANVSITTGGVITVSDQRTFAYFATKVKTAMLDDLAVSAAKLAADAVTTVKILNANVTTAKMALLSVTNAILALLSVDTGNLIDDAVDDTKVGNRVPQTRRRQGSSATDWRAGGTSTQTVTTNRQTGGAINVTAGVATSGTTVVTYPEAFSNPPLAYATGGSNDVLVTATNITASQCTFSWKSISGSALGTFNFYWFAWGPE